MKAVRLSYEASCLESRCGITLSDPEMGFVYKKDFEAEDSETAEFNLSQSLDLSVVSGRKRKKAMAETALNEKTYLNEKKSIDLEARLLLDRIVYLRKMNNLYNSALETNQRIVKLYERALENGECSKLDYSHMRLDLANAWASQKNNTLELNAAYLRLVAMNGGADIDTAGLSYDIRMLPKDFEEWFASVSDSIPVIQESVQREALCKAECELSQSGWWPKLTVGYELEKSVGVNAHSAVVGLSIPLWENRNSVKATKLKSSAAEMQTAVNRQLQHDKLLLLYQQTRTLQDLHETYHNALVELQDAQKTMNETVLSGDKASMDFHLEITSYYELMGKLLDVEFNYQQAKTELMQHDFR